MKCLTDFKVGGNPLSQLPFKLKAKKPLESIRNYAKDNAEPEEIEKAIIPRAPPLLMKPSRQPFPVFNVPLQTLMENEYKISPNIPEPRVVRNAIYWLIVNGLSLEGIFREAGEAIGISKLIVDFNDKLDVFFDKQENPHNVSNVLKTWLRRLPEPLLLYENYETVVQLDRVSTEEQIDELAKVFKTLPKENFAIIRDLFRLMHIATLSVGVNKMDAANITKVIAPNILYSDGSVDDIVALTQTNQINDVLTNATKNYPRIFESTFEDLLQHDYQHMEGENLVSFTFYN